MTMSTLPCNLIQEHLAVGESLSEPDQAHVLACPSCARVAQLGLALDTQIAEQLDGGVRVPDGFADRVMSALDQAPRAAAVDRWLGRRSVQLILANVGLAVALANIVRFVLGTLVPAAGLGGVR
jgi:hypothetical protein